jgi:hypothetical protein
MTNIRFRVMMNIGIEEDRDYPKESSHVDIRYLKTYNGPLI